MTGKDNEALKALEEMENKEKGIIKNEENFSVNDRKLSNTTQDGKTKIDGYILIENEELPFKGKFYPESWCFVYRCPTSLEVANFSTIDEKDTPGIQSAVSDLIKKCFTIIDKNTNNEISKDEINDGDRLFFFLKLREYYLSDKPIQYNVMNVTHNEPVLVSLLASTLKFNKPKKKLLEYFDGRVFDIPISETESIKFKIPTLGSSDKLFKNMVKVYQDANSDDKKSNKKVENFDKKFFIIAPYLFETGDEKIESLKLKFKKIKNNDFLLRKYIDLANSINLTNEKYIEYTYKGSQEEALVRFPGGWKSMFIDTNSFEDLF